MKSTNLLSNRYDHFQPDTPAGYANPNLLPPKQNPRLETFVVSCLFPLRPKPGLEGQVSLKTPVGWLDRIFSCPPKVDGQPDISLGFKKLVTDLPITNLKQALKVQRADDFKRYLDISHPEIWGR